MHIITGASGTVGGAVVDQLLELGQPVKGIVRNEQKATILQNKGASFAMADVKDSAALKTAVEGGSTFLAITPETGKEKDVLAETRGILKHYREAVVAGNVQKVVGISSMGAQHDSGTGNLLMSYMLEHAFEGVPASKIFIRPAYYFKNWMLYFPLAKEKGILPSFFAADMPLPMVSPGDVAQLAAQLLTEDGREDKIYEIAGPDIYTPQDVADAFSKVLGNPITLHQIPRDQWAPTLQQAGFSPDGVKNFVEMTASVVDGKAQSEPQGTIQVTGATTLEDYIRQEATQA